MMKVATLSVFGCLMAGVLNAAVADDYLEQWFMKKHGRPTPVQQAVIRQELASRAFRVEPPPAPVDTIEAHFRGKLGRNTFFEDARLQSAGAAFRTEPPLIQKPWLDQWFEKKFGRPLSR